MKKQRFFMLGIITVLVAVLSLTFVSSTFAKYTSTVSGSDSARVAYWGINKEKTTIALDLFSAAYDDQVQSNDSAKVIAPGTKQEYEVQFIYFESLAPEVDYQLTISTEGSSISSVIENNPNIRFTLNGGEELTWSGLLTAIEALGDSYEAGTINNIKATIGWEWKFSTSEAQDIYDTNMGNMAHDLGIELVLTATAEQVGE